MGFWPVCGSSGPRPFTTRSGTPNASATSSASAFRKAFGGALRAARKIPARAASIRRRNLPLQPGVPPRHERGRPEALLLRRLLGSREGDPLARLAPAFFAEASGLVETPWASAAVPDFPFPETQGQCPPDLDRMLKFRRAFNRLAAADPAVHKLTTEVGHLLKPRSVLRDPGLVERVQALINRGASSSEGLVSEVAFCSGRGGTLPGTALCPSWGGGEAPHPCFAHQVQRQRQRRHTQPVGANVEAQAGYPSPRRTELG